MFETRAQPTLSTACHAPYHQGSTAASKDSVRLQRDTGERGATQRQGGRGVGNDGPVDGDAATEVDAGIQRLAGHVCVDVLLAPLHRNLHILLPQQCNNRARGQHTREPRNGGGQQACVTSHHLRVKWCDVCLRDNIARALFEGRRLRTCGCTTALSLTISQWQLQHGVMCC